MSYTYLQDAAVESSAECFSGIELFVRSKLNLTAAKSSSNASETESCHGSRFGTTFEPLTESHGAALISFAADFHARISARLDAVSESKVNVQDCGESSRGSFAKFDHDSRSLKTRQTLLFEDSTESLLTLPEWGWMRDGECFQHVPLVLHMCDDDCSSWPTPRASDRDNCGGSNARKKALRRGTYVGRKQNPQLSEWLMGWPIDWTALRHQEMDKFQSWLQLHSEFFQAPNPKTHDQKFP